VERIGGKSKAQDVNRELVSTVDVLFGNEEDFSAALGVAIEGVNEDFSHLDVASYESLLHRVAELYPNLKLIASTLRTAHTATQNDWGAIALYEGKSHSCPAAAAGNYGPGRRRRFLRLGLDLRLARG
jgi:2-dehydro-3-deoxygluconokinase